MQFFEKSLDSGNEVLAKVGVSVFVSENHEQGEVMFFSFQKSDLPPVDTDCIPVIP
jgi:hypothetical protein